MAEQLDLTTFTGAHPTNEQFVRQLQEWAFTQRRTEGVHLVFRGPSGGTIRVLRSLLGRPDAALVEKAARLARVDVAAFWNGPHAAHEPTDADPRDDETGDATCETTEAAVDDTGGKAAGDRDRRRAPATRHHRVRPL
jgi:hypothetical protein